MILSKTIMVYPGNKRTYYENKGYDLTPIMHKNDKGKLVCILGAKIEVKVFDLPPRSKYKVLCACDNCGKKRWLEYDKMTNLCHDCAVKIDTYKISMSNATKGKTRTQEQKYRMRKPRLKYRGENHPNWDDSINQEDRIKQGIKSRNTIDYLKWRLDIFYKYCFQCQNCGYFGKKINAHHIESYFYNKELRTDINNGIILCKECHQLFHNTYGKTGTTRIQLEEFLKENKNKKNFIKKVFDPNKKSRQGSKNADHENDTSIYTGVYQNKSKKRWSVSIYHNGENFYLGVFDTEIEAGLAYNEAALDIFGWKATLNKINQKEIDDMWLDATKDIETFYE